MSGDPIYTEMIIEYYRNPSNFGKIVDAHIHQHDANPLCGDTIDLYLNIDDNKISEVKFDDTVVQYVWHVLQYLLK